MDNLNETTMLPDIIKSLFQEWLQNYPSDEQPVIQVVKDTETTPGYHIGSVVTLIASHQYEVTALLDNNRFYLSPINSVIDFEKRKQLDEDRKHWITSAGKEIQVPHVQTAWSLQGSTLNIGRIDERSINDVFGQEASFNAKRKLLTRIYHDGFKWACANALHSSSLAETTKHFAGFYTELSRQSLIRTRSNIEDNEIHLQDLSKQYNETMTTLNRQREDERLFKLAANNKCAKTKAAIERIAKQLQHLVGDRFSSISISDTELVATCTGIQIEDDESGEISMLGDIRCRIELTGKELIKFEPADDNEYRGEYFHPHINSQGSPCLGNIGSDVNKLLAGREWGTLLLLLDEFLNSYNASDPYIQWFKDEQDQYEECLENGDVICTACDDDNCPYWDRRWVSCYDNSDRNSCLDCNDSECPYTEVVRDNCRNEGSPFECLQCTRTWCLLKPEDENDCRERNEIECDDCDNREECSAWEEDDGAEETASNANNQNDNANDSESCREGFNEANSNEANCNNNESNAENSFENHTETQVSRQDANGAVIG